MKDNLLEMYLKNCDNFNYLRLLYFFLIYKNDLRYLIDNFSRTDNFKPDPVYFSKLFERKIQERKNFDNSKNHANFIYYNLPKLQKQDRVRILDYGCGNCILGTELASLLKQKESWGVDIDWDGEKFERNSSMVFNFITENAKVPHEDNFFDIIILSMVLHHIKDVHFVIKECKRMLAKDGVIIIREHDSMTKMDSLFIEIMHRAYMYNSMGSKYLKQKRYFSNYFSRRSLEKMFQDHDLRLVYSKYEMKNNNIKPFRQYVSYFKHNHNMNK